MHGTKTLRARLRGRTSRREWSVRAEGGEARGGRSPATCSRHPWTFWVSSCPENRKTWRFILLPKVVCLWFWSTPLLARANFFHLSSRVKVTPRSSHRRLTNFRGWGWGCGESRWDAALASPREDPNVSSPYLQSCRSRPPCPPNNDSRLLCLMRGRIRFLSQEHELG